MENKKMYEEVVVESGAEEKKGLLDKAKGYLPSKEQVKKGAIKGLKAFGLIAIGAFGGYKVAEHLLGSQVEDSEEEIEDNDDIDEEENIDEE